MLSGCPQTPPDTVVDASCCCRNDSFCINDNYSPYMMEGSFPPTVISVEGEPEIPVMPGQIRRLEVSGECDIDLDFPSPGSTYYEYCPEPCPGVPCESPEDQYCFVMLSNDNMPYEWTVSGYINAFQVLDEESQFCYVPTNPIFPFAQGPIEVNFSVERMGARKMEFRWDSVLQQEVPVANYSVLEEQTYGVSEPITYKIRWAASESLIQRGDEHIVDDILTEASYRLRHQKTDNPATDPYPYSLYYDTQDRSVFIHFVGERVYEEDIPINPPEGFDISLSNEIDLCYPLGRLTYNVCKEALDAVGVQLYILEHIWRCPGDLDGNGQCTSPCYEVAGFIWNCNDDFLHLSLFSDDHAQTFLHELGHAVGLACSEHSTIPYNIMVQNNTGIATGSDINVTQMLSYSFGINYEVINYP